ADHFQRQRLGICAAMARMVRLRFIQRQRLARIVDLNHITADEDSAQYAIHRMTEEFFSPNQPRDADFLSRQSPAAQIDCDAFGACEVYRSFPAVAAGDTALAPQLQTESVYAPIIDES